MLISTQRCGCKESVLISKLPPAQERLSLWPQAPLRGLKTKAVYPQPARLLCPNVCKHGYKAPSTANVYNQGQTTVPTGGQRLKKKKPSTHKEEKHLREKDLREERAEMAREWWAALTSLEKDIPALLLSGHKYSSLPRSLLLLCHTSEVNFGGLQ